MSFLCELNLQVSWGLGGGSGKVEVPTLVVENDTSNKLRYLV